MVYILVTAVSWFANMLVTLLLIRAILSWFVTDTYSTFSGRFYGALIRFTEPIVEPCRRLLSRFNTGVIDFSLFLTMILIELASNLIIRLILIFLI